VNLFHSPQKILIAACIALLVSNLANSQDSGKAKVFYAMETSSFAQSRVPNPAVVRRMVDNLVCAATGKPNPAAAWAAPIARAAPVAAANMPREAAISSTSAVDS
jgi:hypothetical protein